MAIRAVNTELQTVAIRVPHEVMNNVEAVKMPGESVGQFVTATLKREVEYCQRHKAKKPEQSPSASQCKILRHIAMQDNTTTDRELTKALSPTRKRRRRKIEYELGRFTPHAFVLGQFLKEYRRKRSLQIWQQTESD